MRHPDEILVVDRFASLRIQLLTLLAGLGEDDWARPTAAPRWSVKDVTTHLLGGDIAILSRTRHVFRLPSPAVGTYGELVDLVNRLNEQWVVAARRMSPCLLRELLAFTGPKVEAYFSSLGLKAMGGPVSWAGPESAPVWFDIVREFTERWHHQQQIRDATGQSPLYDPYFLSPVFDTFVRALPHSFRHAIAPAGTAVRFEISGEAGGVWFLHKMEQASLEQSWSLVLESPVEPATDVVLPQEAAWRLFTKGINRENARTLAVIRGDATLASPIFATTAIIG